MSSMLLDPTEKQLLALMFGVIALMTLSIPIHDYLMVTYPLRFAPSPIETSLCFQGIMNADKLTWIGDARGETLWWRAVPKRFNKTEYTGFQNLEALQAAVGNYKRVKEDIQFDSKRDFQNHQVPYNCLLSWEILYLAALFGDDYELDDWKPLKNAHQLAHQLANTHTDVFEISGPREDEHATAWFAAYDLFGYPPADPRGEPLYPNLDQHYLGSGAALVVGAVAGAVLAPVLLSDFYRRLISFHSPS